MNIARNMEAIFIVAIAAASLTAFASVPAAPHAKPAVVNADQIVTVVVSGKRLSAIQKADLQARS